MTSPLWGCCEDYIRIVCTMFLAQWLSHGKGSIKATGQLSGWREERPVIVAQGLEIEGAEIHGSISKRIEMILKCLNYVAFISPFKNLSYFP